jgi:hypothetical protein
MAKRRERRRSTAGAAPVEEIVRRAARLGVTPERVLLEYARLAFSDLRRIADWRPGEDGLQVKPAETLDPADAAAIAEIVAAAASGKVYRIKLHDKAPVLGALARCLDMMPKAAGVPKGDEPTQDEIDSARERLIDALDRLAAEAAAGSSDPQSPP